MTSGRVVTFYSYKGGVGRTQALASAGTLLSRWGYKVLCVDWDLEAPGLDRYFHKWLEQKQNPGVVELIHSCAQGKEPQWKDYVVELRIDRSTQPLHLMPAGVQDDSYKSRLQSLDWSVLYDKHALGTFIECIRDEWKENYDFILVDSRTGITDIGGICTIQLPDLLALLFTANHQSLEGIIDVWKSAIAGRNRFAFDRARLLALPVATRFEQRVEYARAQEWLRLFAEKLEPLFAEWAAKEVSIPELLGFARVPYVPYWSFGEELPVLEEDGRDPEQISFAFETIAALLANGLEGTDLLVRNREAYISAAWKVKPLGAEARLDGTPEKTVRLFLSYSYKDSEWVEQLKTHLAPLERQGVIQSWYDRIFTSGAHWQKELDVHIEEADIILFFLSADFLSSEYSQGAEVRRALQRTQEGKARMIPILLRPVNMVGTPFAQMQLLPKEGKPVTSYSNREEVWANISHEIGELAQRIQGTSTTQPLHRSKKDTASFRHLEAMLSELPEVAQDSGWSPSDPFKDVALGPEDAILFLPSAPRDLKKIVRECKVDIRGWGGADFPYGRSVNSKEFYSSDGLRVVDTNPWTASTAGFHLWKMRFSGHFMQRQLLEEDFQDRSYGWVTNPHGRLSVEWALLDIVRPILFARNLMVRFDYEGRFAVKYVWHGLKERSLLILNQQRMGLGFERYVSSLPNWAFDGVFGRNDELYEIASSAAQSLFRQFGWDAMSSSVPEQLRTLLEGRLPY